MDEVARQLKPTHSLLTALHEWQLSFWSNGSGRPEGFFQGRIKSDDLRYRRLEEETKEQSNTLEELKDFMLEQRITREERVLAEKEKAERHVRYWTFGKWALGIIGPALIAVLTWIAHEASPVLRILWEDYLRAHPVVTERLRNHAESEPAAVEHLDDAKIPPVTR